jgi:hypothetical protein
LEEIGPTAARFPPKVHRFAKNENACAARIVIFTNWAFGGSNAQLVKVRVKIQPMAIRLQYPGPVRRNCCGDGDKSADKTGWYYDAIFVDFWRESNGGLFDSLQKWTNKP